MRPPIHRPPGRVPASWAYDQRRGSAASRGYDHRWREKRLAYLRENPLCVECLKEGRSEPATQVDHVIALRKGGADEPSNYQSLCHHHHSVKTAREDRC